MYRIFRLHISEWKLVLLAGDIAAYCLSVALGLYLNPKIGSEIWTFISQHSTAFLLVGLTYFPALALGPLAEQFSGHFGI